jgi:hypothetical protein
MGLMSAKMKVWQAEHHIVDWQSAPYSQNQNYVESKIKHVFAGGIANLSSSGFPHMLLMHMCQMKATAMNAHWGWLDQIYRHWRQDLGSAQTSKIFTRQEQ